MNDQRCFRSTSYLFQYPYGQCLQWHNNENSRDVAGSCPIHECGSFLDTQHCYTHPGCGWCDSGEGTGIGRCMAGAASGPLNNQTHEPQPGRCAPDKWYFTGMPPCPCNGHSTCPTAAGQCGPCANHTGGEQCGQCEPGYFGEARNGGTCARCQCDNRADGCHPLTGACQCRTKGVVGDRCDRCQRASQDTDYVGNATGPNGTCFYPILTGYQYTFRIGGANERHITALNFLHVPKGDEDITMRLEVALRDVNREVFSDMRLAVGVGTKTGAGAGEVTIDEFRNQSTVAYQFSAHEWGLSESSNITLRVYLFNFQTPVTVQVSRRRTRLRFTEGGCGSPWFFAWCRACVVCGVELVENAVCAR